VTTTEQHTQGSVNFTTSDPTISALLVRLHEISDLQALSALTGWDQQTSMPVGAGEVRMHQVATLEGLIHERSTEPEIGSLLEQLAEKVQKAPFTDADRGLYYQVKRGYDQSTKLPRELVEEMARVRSASLDAWVKARSTSNFALFAPWLKRTVELQREMADRFGYVENRYDALLDIYEPGLTARKVEKLFEPVREVSKNLLKRIQDSGKHISTACLEQSFPVEEQMVLSEKILSSIGYDFERGQLARSAHPFTTSFGAPADVRLTVRCDEHFLQMSLMAALHEGGHGLYEQGCAPTLVRTPLANGASLGAHESQSRLWENAVGRTIPFWKGRFHVLQEVFPQQFQTVDVETFVRALNKVEPSLIRVEADEVTYNLHVLIRFELEKALVNGEVSVDELPAAWNAKYREYLGVEPANDAEGVLQDVHWTSGFGYFPTYTLGNLYGAQILQALKASFPDFDERLAGGDSDFILDWLRERMHTFGAIYLPEELITRVTGEKPDPQYFVRYLTTKFEQIYDLQ
jgi:carboxypeptidase Taq